MNYMDEEKVRQAIKAEAREERLLCSQAFSIAGELNCELADVGRLCNELGVRITSCQLGCF